jgi:hypothetical protein
MVAAAAGFILASRPVGRVDESPYINIDASLGNSRFGEYVLELQILPYRLLTSG